MESLIATLIDIHLLSFLDLLDFKFNLFHIIIFFILLLVIFYLFQKINKIKSEKELETLEEAIVDRNIELKTKHAWLKTIDWKVILLVLAVSLLFYIFYKNKLRKKILRK